MSEYLLELNNISKAFPGVQALDDVTLKVRPGTVHALIGENGAGKSTLMKCLYRSLAQSHLQLDPGYSKYARSPEGSYQTMAHSAS